jgi:hypothetical protein
VIALYGSSSCPWRPATRIGRAAVRVGVRQDGRSGGFCTSDLAATGWRVTLPAALRGRGLGLDLEAQAARLGDLIDAADVRDQAAEIRDRAAEARDAAAALRGDLDREQHRLAARDYAQCDIDRLWAAADRDSAASDREEIREMAVSRSPSTPPIR